MKAAAIHTRLRSVDGGGIRDIVAATLGEFRVADKRASQPLRSANARPTRSAATRGTIVVRFRRDIDVPCKGLYNNCNDLQFSVTGCRACLSHAEEKVKQKS